jgi:hypothetical protein
MSLLTSYHQDNHRHRLTYNHAEHADISATLYTPSYWCLTPELNFSNFPQSFHTNFLIKRCLSYLSNHLPFKAGL